MAEQGAAAGIAAGYVTDAGALELGTVVVDGAVDPAAKVRIPFATLNRHGLVAGATGTGKTKTLQNLAEQCSAAGIPVLLADIKGDLSGLARPGESSDRTTKRAQETGDDWAATGYPVQFLSLGAQGIGVPVRATITAFGPILLSKVLGLNETQESTLGLVFHWADQKGLALLDTKDLRSVIQHLLSDEGKAELEGIGGVSASTAGVILRALVNLEARGGDEFFGEPEFDPSDLLTVTDSKGAITLLELADQQADPTLFSTFLMWLLAELFEDLPEAGDIERPKLVFFFDEAHLLFHDASKAFGERIEQTVKLIRSKGVGVFFCTQLPTDIPNGVLSQLGARVQHALRAFTPDDQKALTRTARTYPKSTVYDIEESLTSLGTGEAIVTVLSEVGAPTPVAWTRLRAPRSLMAAIGEPAVIEAAKASPLWGRYGETIDRESAYERLTARTGAVGRPETPPADPVGQPSESAPQARDSDDTENAERGRSRQAETEAPGMLEQLASNPAVKSFFRSAANQLGREITRGLFGTARRR